MISLFLFVYGCNDTNFFYAAKFFSVFVKNFFAPAG